MQFACLSGVLFGMALVRVFPSYGKVEEVKDSVIKAKHHLKVLWRSGVIL